VRAADEELLEVGQLRIVDRDAGLGGRQVRDVTGDRSRLRVLGDPGGETRAPEPDRDAERELDPRRRLPPFRRERPVAVEALRDRRRERVGVGAGGPTDPDQTSSRKTISVESLRRGPSLRMRV
jgi:hypothetical protein